MNTLNTPIRRLRYTGIAEGTSLILLLFIAMPLKYFYGMPELVKIIGWIHGILFILYLVALINVKLSVKWPLTRTFIALIAALIPFGTFALDKRLKKEEQIEAIKTFS